MFHVGRKAGVQPVQVVGWNNHVIPTYVAGSGTTKEYNKWTRMLITRLAHPELVEVGDEFRTFKEFNEWMRAQRGWYLYTAAMNVLNPFNTTYDAENTVYVPRAIAMFWRKGYENFPAYIKDISLEDYQARQRQRARRLYLAYNTTIDPRVREMLMFHTDDIAAEVYAYVNRRQ